MFKTVLIEFSIFSSWSCLKYVALNRNINLWWHVLLVHLGLVSIDRTYDTSRLPRDPFRRPGRNCSCLLGSGQLTLRDGCSVSECCLHQPHIEIYFIVIWACAHYWFDTVTVQDN